MISLFLSLPTKAVRHSESRFIGVKNLNDYKGRDSSLSYAALRMTAQSVLQKLKQRERLRSSRTFVKDRKQGTLIRCRRYRRRNDNLEITFNNFVVVMDLIFLCFTNFRPRWGHRNTRES
ncbi:MAG: hypothetical protein IIA49_12945 [Bacteroidetes bacterium]|nr:hypothetical protein [Bacteroidota bacterium]